MSRQNDKGLFLGIAASVGWPLIWGLTATTGFYVALHYGALGKFLPDETEVLMRRYLAAHWVEYAELGLFFIGLAALVIKAATVVGQRSTLGMLRLDAAPALEGRSGSLRVEDATTLLDWLETLPPRVRGSYLGRRILDALESVERKETADGLDAELKHLSDLDAARQQDGYALVRIVIWATPMLGFLGTVIGITLALGELSPVALVQTPQEAMKGLLSGLSVAFDTTAVALTLSIALMFIQFIIDRLETQLLEAVDARSAEELVGRFEQVGAAGDPHAASIERTGKAMIETVEALVARQAELWRSTIDEAHHAWRGMMKDSGAQMSASLSGALAESMQNHAAQLVAAERSAAERAQRQASQLEQTLAENAAVLRKQQTELTRHAALLTEAVKAAGEIASLERSLNDNLQALAGAKHFEETVISLSAAIHLLTARLGATAASRVELKAPSSSNAQGRAA